MIGRSDTGSSPTVREGPATLHGTLPDGRATAPLGHPVSGLGLPSDRSPSGPPLNYVAVLCALAPLRETFFSRQGAKAPR